VQGRLTAEETISGFRVRPQGGSVISGPQCSIGTEAGTAVRNRARMGGTHHPDEAGGRFLEELETLLAQSRANDQFKADVRQFWRRGEASRIRVDSYIPTVKVQRLLKQMLASEPDLPIHGVAVSGASGCSDFVGTVEAQTPSTKHVFDFGWCCRWRAEQEGWTDYFGFPDQIRAAQEFDWRCFHTWRRR